MTKILTYSTGWVRDHPDPRDYHLDHERIKPLIDHIKLHDLDDRLLPAKADLRHWCPPIESQGKINACTANAAAAIVEYMEYRAYGNYRDASRLFIYKTTRNLGHQEGDSGTQLRWTMAALTLFGAPPEAYWPYTDEKPEYNAEPPAFCYAFAQNYQALKYARLDPPDVNGETMLKKIKGSIAAGIPPMFGVSLFSSWVQSKTNGGAFPFPSVKDKLVGGHAMVAVGYDDTKEITNTSNNFTTIGAVQVRNSWGEKWGDKGYGWLPYAYIEQRLAVDWWVLLSQEYVCLKEFGL